MRTIEQSSVIRLKTEDSRALANALLKPGKPTAKLRAAARRYLNRFGT